MMYESMNSIATFTDSLENTTSTISAVWIPCHTRESTESPPYMASARVGVIPRLSMVGTSAFLYIWS